jgi:hypothetical protein
MISPAHAARLNAWLRAQADVLGLRDWTLVTQYDADLSPSDLLRGTSNEQTPACEMLALHGRKRAVISLARDFSTLPSGEQKHALVHELVHIHFAAARDVVRLELAEARAMGQSEYSLLFWNFDRHLEYGVDALAEVLSKGLPDLPSDVDDTTDVEIPVLI